MRLTNCGNGIPLCGTFDGHLASRDSTAVVNVLDSLCERGSFCLELLKYSTAEQTAWPDTVVYELL